MTALVVLAKAPDPGRSKTRLSPPCTPLEAARIAEAALVDTLETVATTPCSRRVLVLDGTPGAWLPSGFDVVAQVNGGLDARIAGAFRAVGGPAMLVGMDTPQVVSGDLIGAMALLDASDSILGPALDGGWWTIGLHEPDDELFLGVPMSRPDTGAQQLGRMLERGLDPALLPTRRDVDTFADAVAIAACAPDTRFAAAVTALQGKHA